jgi:hypothetical protein
MPPAPVPLFYESFSPGICRTPHSGHVTHPRFRTSPSSGYPHPRYPRGFCSPARDSGSAISPSHARVHTPAFST